MKLFVLSFLLMISFFLTAKAEETADSISDDFFCLTENFELSIQKSFLVAYSKVTTAAQDFYCQLVTVQSSMLTTISQNQGLLGGLSSILRSLLGLEFNILVSTPADNTAACSAISFLSTQYGQTAQIFVDQTLSSITLAFKRFISRIRMNQSFIVSWDNNKAKIETLLNSIKTSVDAITSRNSELTVSNIRGLTFQPQAASACQVPNQANCLLNTVSDNH